MKCEKCNEKEANFFYSSNINGEVTRWHLCHECAEAEGLVKQQEEFFSDLFTMRSPFGLLDSMWRDDFWNTGLFGRNIFGPTATMSRSAIAQKESGSIPDKAGDDLLEKREISQLRAKMQRAVEKEDFEEAIKLRDEIKARENRA